MNAFGEVLKAFGRGAVAYSQSRSGRVEVKFHTQGHSAGKPPPNRPRARARPRARMLVWIGLSRDPVTNQPVQHLNVGGGRCVSIRARTRGRGRGRENPRGFDRCATSVAQGPQRGMYRSFVGFGALLWIFDFAFLREIYARRERRRTYSFVFFREILLFCLCLLCDLLCVSLYLVLNDVPSRV
jgi:hypothetical protein